MSLFICLSCISLLQEVNYVFFFFFFFYCKFNSDHFSPNAVHSFKAQSHWYETLSHKSDLHRLYNFYFISLGHKHSILIGNCLARKMHFSRIRYHRLSRGQYFPMVLINPFFFCCISSTHDDKPQREKEKQLPITHGAGYQEAVGGKIIRGNWDTVSILKIYVGNNVSNICIINMVLICPKEIQRYTFHTPQLQKYQHSPAVCISALALLHTPDRELETLNKG